MLFSDTIINYFKYVATLKYDDTPDYDKCRQMFENGLKKLGETNAGELKFKLSPSKAGPSKTAKQLKVDDNIDSPRKRAVKVQRPIVETESDSASEVEIKSPMKSIKRGIAQGSTTSTEKRPKISSTIDKENSSSVKPGSTVVNNECHSNNSKEKKNKVVNINLQLDVSIDANVVINVKRNPRKGKTEKVSATNSIQHTASDEDEDVIPNSNENTPVAKVRVFKSKIGTPKKTLRKSPRSVL